MSDAELQEKLDLIEKGIHERFDSIHRRHRRIENYLNAILGLLLLILLIAFVSYSCYVPPHP
jgi:hypothetical protein